jgi:hypothetical protein
MDGTLGGQLRRLVAVAAALLVGGVGAVLLHGVGDSGGDTAALPDEDRSVDPGAWEQVVPGGDCQCSDGSAFSFWVREANPDRVLVLLQDGGNCFSPETCAPERGLHTTAITEGPDRTGVFDFAEQRNPFTDFSVVYVPYCTGDAHLGDAITEHAPGVTVRHKGMVNGTAALDHLATTFPGASEVVVMGESAGAVAAPLYAGLVADRLPQARITALANGAGGTPELPDEVSEAMFTSWGLADALPAWPATGGGPAEGWSLVPRLFVESARHDPGIVFARVDHAYDERQELGASLFGVPPEDLLARIDANEALIESAGVDLLSYVAAGDGHGVLSDGTFYSVTVDGLPLVEWVDRLVGGEPVDDVHCVDCRTGPPG